MPQQYGGGGGGVTHTVTAYAGGSAISQSASGPAIMIVYSL